MIIASVLNPPPGKTTIATPVFLPLGGKIVIVGAMTSNTASDVFPPIASGVCAVKTLSGGCVTPAIFGAPFGQSGICFRPDGGCHTPTVVTFACARPDAAGERVCTGPAALFGIPAAVRPDNPAAQARIIPIPRMITSSPAR
ncbi:MAG: hypothetical protein V4475_20015 [Pseudomonadota bacterium]